jgi:hypothetical protein
VRLLHSLAKIQATFDDPNLVSRAGLVPVMALAQRAGLAALAGEHVRPARRCGVNAHLKVGCLVAGMIAGADSIDDLGLLRHGAMPALFGGVRAPSTLGSFLRSFTWGNVLQLQKVSRLLLAELARRAPLLPGKGTLAFVDIDSQQKRVYGYHKQGAAFGHTKIQGKSLLVRGLNALAATISTQHRDHAVVEQVLADWTDGPLAHLPSLGVVRRERGLACPRRHQPQPAARRRVPGQPRLREGQRRHAAPRPDRRRRPHRPPWPGQDHLAPARRLAPPGRVDEPVRGRLRPAVRCSGLTSPDTGHRTPSGPLRPPRPRLPD